MVVVYHTTTASASCRYRYHIWRCYYRGCSYHYGSSSRIASRYTRYFSTYLITYSISPRFSTRWYRNRTIAVKRWRCRACYTCCWSNNCQTYSTCSSCTCIRQIISQYRCTCSSSYCSVTYSNCFVISFYAYQRNGSCFGSCTTKVIYSGIGYRYYRCCT